MRRKVLIPILIVSIFFILGFVIYSSYIKPYMEKKANNETILDENYLEGYDISFGCGRPSPVSVPGGF